MKWFELKGALKINYLQHSCYGQGHFPLDQSVESPIQTDLEHFQGWDMNGFSGQPVPVTKHPQIKELLPNSQSKPAFFQLEAIF